MGYILTGAVMVSGTYVGDDGIERRYEIVRGQNVASLNLPPHAEKELINRVRPLGGRRGKPIPYFTYVDAGGNPSAPTEEASVTAQALVEGLHKSRVAAGVVEPDSEPVLELPVVEEDEDGANDAPATTPDEAAEAVASEPVVSPTEDEVVDCGKEGCAAGGDVASCEDDKCPLNEAPVEDEVVPEGVAEAPAKKPAAKPKPKTAAKKKPAAKKKKK